MAVRSSYDGAFYDLQIRSALNSASEIVPKLVEILRPKSFLDVGCGMGAWAGAFEKAGVERVAGIDGPWVDQTKLMIPTDCFEAFDFSKETAPFKPRMSERKFDVAMTLEFLEHVEMDRCEAILDLLTSMADTVVLGAAIPGQGGTDHINEQWQSVWIAQMATRGFVACDFIRPIFWNNPRVAPWYKQNTLVYFRGAVPDAVSDAISRALMGAALTPADIVHPEIFDRSMAKIAGSIKGNLKSLGGEVGRRLFPDKSKASNLETWQA